MVDCEFLELRGFVNCEGKVFIFTPNEHDGVLGFVNKVVNGVFILWFPPLLIVLGYMGL